MNSQLETKNGDKRGRFLSAIAVLAFLLLSACGGSGGGDGLSRNSCDLLGSRFKVLFGSECSRSESAVVQIGVAPPGEIPGFCSGTLISPQHVLTAGHCVPDLPDGILVNAGTAGAAIPARKIFVHPGFRIDDTLNLIFNDAAIIELESPAPAPVAPLLVSGAVAVGDVVSLFGYGVDENGFSGVLKSGELRVSGVDQNFINALFAGDGVNSCLGDSGGPLVAEKFDAAGNSLVGIVGLVSTGTDPLCQIGDISTYTNVQSADLVNFIRSVVPTVQIN